MNFSWGGVGRAMLLSYSIHWTPKSEWKTPENFVRVPEREPGDGRARNLECFSLVVLPWETVADRHPCARPPHLRWQWSPRSRHFRYRRRSSCSRARRHHVVHQHHRETVSVFDSSVAAAPARRFFKTHHIYTTQLVFAGQTI